MSLNPDLKVTLSLLNPNVVKNVKVATPRDFPVPYGLRIDQPPVPLPFWPRMPASAAPSEDSTVPRVITASTIIGCMNGAAFVIDNAFIRRGGDFSCDNYYVITAFPFEHCLLPNNELVYDAEDTQEQWLITYDKKTKNFGGFTVGEMFMHSVGSTMLPNSRVNTTQGVFYLRVFKDPGIAISKGKVLQKGFYKLEIDLTRYTAKRVRRMRFDEDNLIKETTISEEEYNSFRKIGVKKGY